MNGIEKLIDRIRKDSDAECVEIAKNAAEECERLSAEYSRREQEEYWKTINAGTKEAEQRLQQLNDLAALESKKKIRANQDEMLNEAFALAAKKLSQLPEQEYNKILKKHGIEDNYSPDDLVDVYKQVLSLAVLAVLFD